MRWAAPSRKTTVITFVFKVVAVSFVAVLTAHALSADPFEWWHPPSKESWRSKTISSKEDAERLPKAHFNQLVVKNCSDAILLAIPDEVTFQTVFLDDLNGPCAKGIQSLSRFDDLTRLYCSGSETLDTNEFSAVLALVGVEAIHFWGYKRFGALRKTEGDSAFSTLIELSLNSGGMPGGEFWKELVEADKLISLTLENVRDVTVEDFGFLPFLRQLTALRVFDAPVNGMVAGPISDCKSLRSLELQVQLGLTPYWLEVLARTPSLANLDLRNHLPFKWSDLAAFPKLESLTLSGCAKLDDATPDSMSKLKNLRRLELSFCDPSPATMQSLSKLPSLEELGLVIGDKFRFSSDSGRYIADCQKLRTLYFYDCGFGGKLDWISRIPTLENILVIHDKGFTDKDVAALSECETLVNIGLSGVTGPGKESWKALGKLPSLRVLMLSNSDVPNDGLEWIKESKSLRTLEVSGCNSLNSDFIYTLIDAKTLEHVGLGFCNMIEDEAVTFLKKQRTDLIVFDRLQVLP